MRQKTAGFAELLRLFGLNLLGQHRAAP